MASPVSIQTASESSLSRRGEVSARAYGAVRRHRHAVHGGGGKVRAGEGGPDGRGGDVAEGLVQGQAEGLAGRPVGELGQAPCAIRSRAVARGTS